LLEAVLVRSFVSLAVLLLASSAWAIPPEGYELKVRRGFFTETDIGAFMTVGGDDQYSNIQTYLQLGIGYDILDALELGLHVGIGSNAANCFSGTKAPGAACPVADNFTLTFLDATIAYLIRVGPRLYLAPKIAGGYTLLDPPPVTDNAGAPIGAGPNVGAGVGIEYATHMDHFSIGLDVFWRMVLAGPGIQSFQIFPRVKYTF
jgi:hypothetical protein